MRRDVSEIEFVRVLYQVRSNNITQTNMVVNKARKL